MTNSRGTIEILAGPAGAGKTARLLELYAQELATAQKELRPGTTLWLSPTNRSRTAIRRKLLPARGSVLVQPQILTFKDFAEQILRSAPKEVLPLTEAMRHTLLRRVIGDLLAEKKLAYFAGIASTAGFLDIVSSLISELKRDEAWPDDFERVTRAVAGAARPRDRELALIYRTYQDLLLAKNVYDGEGRFWSARQALDEGHWGPFAELSLVVVDGFTDFTRTQYEILARLSQRAKRVMLGLPLESGPRRTDLFAKTRAVFEELERNATLLVNHLTAGSCQDGSDRDSAAADPARPPALNHLAEWLFANPRETPRSGDASGLEVMAVAGQKGEVQLLAARVKQLLHDGVPAEDIVVAVRGLDDYSDLIEEIFTAGGIPFYLESGIPLGRSPVLKFLLNVLHLESEDWPFARLRSLMNSSYFRPTARHVIENGAARAVAPLLRKFQLDSGRKQILEILHREASHAVADAPIPESSAKLPIQQASDLLHWLSATLDRLRRKHNFRGWADFVSLIAADLGWPPPATAERNSADSKADLDAWETFKSILYDASRGEDLADHAPPDLSLADFLEELNDLIQRQSLPRGTEQSGRVRVLDAPQVRNLEVPYLFLAGLTERSFPQHRGDDCLYHEIERRELNRQAAALGERLELGHRTSRAHEEMLLFYGIVTRARQRLILSYPGVNASGEPLSPSPYVKSIEDLFTPGSIPRTTDDQLDPVPKANRLISDGDLRLRSVFEARQRQPNLLRFWLESPTRRPVGRNILAAAQLGAQRFETPGFTPAEGLLRNADNLARIHRRYSREHEFSASQLEEYARCPFRFFLGQVLDIQPLPSPETGTDHARRGSLVHDTLAELYQKCFVETSASDSGGLSADDLSDRFQELISAKLGRHIERTELQSALMRVEEQLLRECGPEFGMQHEMYQAGFQDGLAEPLAPRMLEASFGKPHPNAPIEAHAKQLPPLAFGAGTDEVRVTGRIDRVDVGRLSDGRSVFNVVDYKTGRKDSHKTDDVAIGHELQLALYALAIQKLGIVGPDAIPWQFGYWKIRGEGFEPALKTGRRKKDAGIERLDEAVWQSLVETLHDIVPRLATGIRQGEFPIASQDENCAGRCPYGTVCRVNQIRPLTDKLKKTWKP